MKMSTVTVIGANGMLGFAVSEYFASRGYNVQKITRADFDITKDPMPALEQMLVDADVVVNCAGIIHSQVEKNTIESILAVNSVFPKNLALFCKKMNIKCFHITTSCVYTGNEGSYSEDDAFDAPDIYGMTKNAGEPMNCMTLRTSIIGEERGQSRSLMEWARNQQGKDVIGLVNHFWNGVTTVHLAEIIEKILDQDLYLEGIYHLHSPNTISRKDLFEILSEVYELHLSVKPVEASQLCDRSLSSKYSYAKLLCTKTIQMQVYEMKEFFELAQIPVIQTPFALLVVNKQFLFLRPMSC
jgi:dTDP-4-dehydrorhamnose reductase